MNTHLSTVIESLKTTQIAEQRQAILDSIIDKLLPLKVNTKRTTLLFVCTHNSRRSQMAQVWADYFARDFNLTNLDIQSCGTEVTACNFRVIYTLRNLGFVVSNPGGTNPLLTVSPEQGTQPITLYSKDIESCIKASSTSEQVIAMMTCDHADQNCPIMPEVTERLQLLYADPKISDDTPQESQIYSQRCLQIGSEMYYLINNLREC